MSEVKISEVKKPAAASAAASPKNIKAVYGLMVDPHTGCTFNLKPCELLKMTPWVQSQIDAGKLLLEAGSKST